VGEPALLPRVPSNNTGWVIAIATAPPQHKVTIARAVGRRIWIPIRNNNLSTRENYVAARGNTIGTPTGYIALKVVILLGCTFTANTALAIAIENEFIRSTIDLPNCPLAMAGLLGNCPSRWSGKRHSKEDYSQSACGGKSTIHRIKGSEYELGFTFSRHCPNRAARIGKLI